MASLISNTIQGLVVPGIMLVLLIYAMVIAGSVNDSELKTSAWAGFWAGLVVFVIYVVSELGRIREPNLNFSSLPGLLFLPLAVGFGIGFGFLWMVKVMVPTRLVGIITMLLSATSTSALFAYVFIDSSRVSVLYWVLGTALGILLHIVLLPRSVRDLFN